MASKDWEGLRNALIEALKGQFNELLDGTVGDLEGPIRNAANQLVVAIRRGPAGAELVEEIKDQLALMLVEKKLQVKSIFSDNFEAVIRMGLAALFNGAVAGLAAWKTG